MSDLKKFQTTEIESIAKEAAEVARLDNNYTKMFATAKIVQKLKELVSQPEFLEMIMPLQNTPLGFLTDNKSGYSKKEIVDAIVEATMYGLLPINNHFNIIKGRCYIAKNGMKHMINNLEYITDLRIKFSDVIEKDKVYDCIAEISWHDTRSKKSYSEITSVLVKRESYSTYDYTLGKAKRKAYAWLYENVTGNTVPEGEVSDYIDITNQKPEKPEKKAIDNAPKLQPATEKKKKVLAPEDEAAWTAAIDFVCKSESLDLALQKIANNKEITPENLLALENAAINAKFNEPAPEPADENKEIF
jgi:hypothetical protein